MDPELYREVSERSPKFRQALQAEIEQIETAKQHYLQGLTTNAHAAMASLLSAYPELQNIQSNDQFRGALAVLAQQNPQRASEIVAHIQRTNAIVGHWQQAAQAQNQQAEEHYQREFAKFAAAEDAKFDQAMPEIAGDKEALRKLGEAAIATLKNVGFSDDDLRRAYRGEASLSLRDHRAQLILAKAASYDRLKAETPQKRVRSVPPVMRPGSSVDRREEYGAHQLSELRAKLSASGNVRDAAKYLAAKRANNR